MYIVGAILTTILGCWLFGLIFEPGYVASLIMGSFILYVQYYTNKKSKENIISSIKSYC